MLRNVSGIVRGEGVEEEREKEGNEKGRRQAGGTNIKIDPSVFYNIKSRLF